MKSLIIPKTDTDECIIWDGAVSSNGYGYYWFEGKSWRVHRLSFTIFYGTIPKGLLVCHTCDNKLCYNPRHLFLGTNRDNTQDCIKKGRFSFPIKKKSDKHGTKVMYSYHGCRCDECKKFNTESMKKYNRNKKSSL